MWSLFISMLALLPIAGNPVPDRQATRYELQPQKRTDRFDFSGPYPHLEKIDIDARRKKRVEFLLTGEYPALEEVCYAGSFGTLQGSLTGNFPLLSSVAFLCTSCAMELDLRGEWKKDCAFQIQGQDAPIQITLPAGVALSIETFHKPGGHVHVSPTLKKKGWGVWHQTYVKRDPSSQGPCLSLSIATGKGDITLILPEEEVLDAPEELASPEVLQESLSE